MPWLSASIAVFTSAAPFGVELPTQDEHAAIGLVALEPAALVGVVVRGEHTIGMDAKPSDLGEGAHGPGIERLRRSDQDALERRHLLNPDIVGEVGDHGHVAERGATGAGAVERGRQLAERPGQVHAVGRRLGCHAAAMSQPGHRGHPAVGLGSVRPMKAVQAADELGFEPVDRPPDVDQIRTQGVGRDLVDGLVDEGIDSVIETVACMRHRERFHRHSVPNICSLSTGQCGPGGVLEPCSTKTFGAPRGRVR